MKVKGSISKLVGDIKDFDKESIIGLPIRDEKGLVIGTIIGVDLTGDSWFGDLTEGYDIT